MTEEGVTVINGQPTENRPSRARTIVDEPTSTSRSVSPKKPEDPPKRFLNGWSKEQERLMSEWSDIAMCYRWIHDKSEKIYHSKSLWINLPVIILTTLGGTANFGIQSVFSDNASKQYASFAIGGISLFAGLLTTIGNYLRYAQLEESHRVASIAWGKFQRLIAVELALNPNERMDSLDFLKICRADLDRLIEQSPPIPQVAIGLFEERFSTISNLKKPDICGELQHTRVFESSETRLKQMAVDATIMLKQRRNMLTELTMPKIQERINKEIDTRLELALEERKRQLAEEMEIERQQRKETEEEYTKMLEERQRKITEEIELEKKRLPVIQGPQLKQGPTNSRLESRLSLKRSMILLPGIQPIPRTMPLKNTVIVPLEKVVIDTPRLTPRLTPQVTPRPEQVLTSQVSSRPEVTPDRSIPASTDHNQKSIESFVEDSA